MLKQIFSFFKKDNRTLKEILSSTFEDVDFNYELVKMKPVNCYEIPVSESIKNLPNITFDLMNVDYYA